MSVPRLVVSGLEPGPAVALASGALLSAFAGTSAVRPVTLGVDVPLWRLLHAAGTKAPRVLDPMVLDAAVAGELYDEWSAGCDLLALVAVEPALDRWQGIEGSRAVDVATALDAPLVLVVDARDRGVTAAAAAVGVRSLAPSVEFAGAVVVGGEEHGAAEGLRSIIEERAGLPLLGWIPPQLSEQFVRQYCLGSGALRQLGPRPPGGGAVALCREAASYLRRDELEAVASRHGFVAPRPRKLLAAVPAAAGLTLAVGWGPPLEPFALENVDLLHAMGLALAPLHIGRDHELPPGVSGLLLAGLLDEDALGEFAANAELKAALAAAVAGGLPTLALGGGALLLLRRLTDSRGRSRELAGVVPAEAELLEWYRRPRYVRARAARENPYDQGEGDVCELFDLEFLTLQQESFAYHVGETKGEGEAEGFVSGRCLATTLLPTLPARPQLASSFVTAMRSAASGE